ncbi:MAG TPA: PH domain-containing protein [Anaerolineae bacterium]|nr:PH domain-containing protein [Anaerolineae bacterium]
MENRIYHPELLPRRGEWIAWGLSLVSALSLVLLRVRYSKIPFGVYIFVLFFIFAATSISLGNWMDRHTILIINQQGIAYKNGIRKTNLEWEDIKEVRVLQSRWGKRVQILGPDSHFEFRTLGKVIYQGEPKGNMGFSQGEEILQTILDQSGMQKLSQSNQSTTYTHP